MRLAADGFVQGSNHQFLPNNSMTRAEFLTLVERIFGFSAKLPQAGEVTILSNEHVEAEEQYSDLSPDHWAYPAIKAAVKLGLIAGYNDGTIRPNEPITRAEIAVLLNLFIQDRNFNDLIHQVEVVKPVFKDVLYGAWAYEAINNLWQLDIINGVSQGLFAPHRYMTRAEGAVILDRYLGLASSTMGNQ